MAVPRSAVGLVARPEIVERLALQAEFNPTRLGRAGAAIVRDAELYLQFFAELGPEPERAEAKTDGPCCERCGQSTPWRMMECPGCRGLR